MSARLSSSSSVVIPTFAAISSSVGARPSLLSSSAIARSISRARERTERGTQSSARSSSMIEPLIRAIAYVSNLMSRVGVVALDRAHQAEQPVRDEVALVDVRGQPGAEPAGDVLDERRILEDQPVAKLLVAGAAVLEPQSLGLFDLRHRTKNTASSAGLLTSCDEKLRARATQARARARRRRIR